MGLVSARLHRARQPDRHLGLRLHVQPENGGLGVFAHEFGHDLGLPDLYDTSGNTGGAENSTGFWTLMSSGANIGDGGPDGIGDDPTDLGAYENFQLGWLQPQGKQGPFYDVANAGKRSSHTLGSNVPATKKAQALFTVLPDKHGAARPRRAVRGLEDVLEHPGRRDRHDDDEDGDAGTASPPRSTTRSRRTGTTPTSRPQTSVPRGRPSRPTGRPTTDPNGAEPGQRHHRLHGRLGRPHRDAPRRHQRGPVPLLDGRAVMEPGIRVDNIALNGALIGTAETDEGWTFDGFRHRPAPSSRQFFNAYIAENRQYDGYDTSLKTAYNFGFANTPS